MYEKLIMPKKYDYRTYTPEEINLISNLSLTAKEIAKMIGVSAPTIHRTRKRLGIKVILGASKKGRPNPKKERKELRTCANVDCSNTFEIVQSHPKRYCSHKCHSKTLKFPNRTRKCKDTIPEYKKYAGKVHRLSQKTYEKHIDIINPNRHKRTLCGVENGYQLDHIVSVRECFERGISEEDASSVDNLRMLEWRDNLARNKKAK